MVWPSLVGEQVGAPDARSTPCGKKLSRLNLPTHTYPCQRLDAALAGRAP
jgi:hypothetical protein